MQLCILPPTGAELCRTLCLYGRYTNYLFMALGSLLSATTMKVTRNIIIKLLDSQI